MLKSQAKIDRPQRESQWQRQGLVVWFTGLSGSGKSTLSEELERRLFERNLQVYCLDGDVIRSGLNSDLGFSMEDRSENIRRIGELAKLFFDATLITLVACISPIREDRDRIRQQLQEGRFIEVFLDCPLEVCEARDTKGLYRKARNGEIKELTGISSPYEPPLSPEIHLRTDRRSIDDCVDAILKFLDHNRVL